MNPLRLAGLGAALVALSYLIGILFVLGPLAPLGLGLERVAPARVVAFAQATPWLLPLWVTIIYDVSALGTGLAGLGLARRTHGDLPGLALGLGAVALIWSALTLASGMIARTALAELARLAPTDPEAAGAAWAGLHLIETGLSGRTEALGGLWILLVGLAGLRAGLLTGAAAILGLFVGLAGLATYLPPLSEPGGLIFGLGAILWCAWAAVEWLRG